MTCLSGQAVFAPTPNGVDGQEILNFGRVSFTRTSLTTEQAFEWEHVMYLFYPYFWGRKSKWTASCSSAFVVHLDLRPQK